MFNVEHQVFCHRLRQSQTGLVQEGLSYRYTLMTLLGLHRAERAGFVSPVPILSVLEGLLGDLKWSEGIGDLGLLIWACAVISPAWLPEALAAANLRAYFDGSVEVRERRTLELSWLLAGLSHAARADDESRESVSGLARRTFDLLRENQGGRGTFGHLAANGTIAGYLRGRIGSFADQVYPIYAFSRFAQAYDASDALERAKQCADSICRVQGSEGQWWWHYDGRNGGVLEEYPVYSVHQEGMAPMALFALEQAAGLDYKAHIFRGLNWIAGQNELAVDMRHESGLVWRCLRHRSKFGLYRERAKGFLNLPKGTGPEDLMILRECRPYELGWLLYAFADIRSGGEGTDRTGIDHIEASPRLA